MHDRPAPIVTTEHLERAYAQLRKADWPSLADMERWAKQYGVVRGRATSLAHGHALPAEPTGAPAPAPRPCGPATAASPYSARAAGHTERRRRDDLAGALDLKSRAAGERDDD